VRKSHKPLAATMVGLFVTLCFKMNMDKESIKLEITKDEALVLFEILSRYSDTDILSIEYQAEQRALWNLACVFEKTISEAFDPDYKKVLETARNRLQDEA